MSTLLRRSQSASLFFIRGFIFLALIVTGNAMAGYQYQDGLRINSHDGVRLAASVFTPNDANFGNPAPAVVFINSWALEHHEYLLQAAKLADKGYVVLSYATRGFGVSGGLVNVAGPDDIKDARAVVDWLLANTPTDPSRIGIAGISYGGGISLLAAANDERLSAVVAMSGWADLSASLYGGNTPDMVFGGILVGAGYLTGRMDPIIATMYGNLLRHQNIPETLAWAGQRSPQTVIDALNARGVPIYISHNFRDELFEPNASMRFFSELTGPKKLDLNLGNHATAELGGLFGLRNHVWSNVQRWFDQWLRGQDTGILDEKPVSMAVKLDQQRDEFLSWPSAEVQNKAFYLSPRGWFSNGDLRTSPNNDYGNNTFNSGLLSGATAGIPVISSTFEAHLQAPIVSFIPGINRTLALVYESNRFNETQRIRGAPTLSLWLRPSNERFQTIAYLYDLDNWGFGTLITHGPVTVLDAVPGQDRQVQIELIATAYDLPAGHRLALAIDTADPQYSPPTLGFYQLTVPYSGSRQSRLVVPVRE
ncbi:CocE/NonD family hydrolase [Permianibacter aggregans]|uniref:Putative CocE/NonD family hydrolase n=1 Tax=Permianibacter aggregans TaxID=1510150 RepID=A0A4R6U635_9GAMM|nr:CocE/NonD family hydrolase [Permianibacter aggregans]TDQ41958.1 putative CocE/NonD family hydrolase [Permianibacter aggregans]